MKRDNKTPLPIHRSVYICSPKKITTNGEVAQVVRAQDS